MNASNATRPTIDVRQVGLTAILQTAEATRTLSLRDNLADSSPMRAFRPRVLLAFALQAVLVSLCGCGWGGTPTLIGPSPDFKLSITPASAAMPLWPGQARRFLSPHPAGVDPSIRT